MLKFPRSLLVLILAFVVSSNPAKGQTVNPNYVDGKVYLRLNQDLPAAVWDQMTVEFGITSIKQPFKSPGMGDVYALYFDAQERVTDLLEAFTQRNEVEYVEKVPLYFTTYTPDDLITQQWGLFKIQAENAWDLAKGDQDIVIAVIDNAIRSDHEDIAPQIWTNPNETPGDGVDNDNNGFIDDTHGFDVADDDVDVNPPVFNSIQWSHGSHVAGIAAASTDNGKGVASIGFGCSILPIKAKSDTSAGTSIDASAEGIDYAIVSGAKVVNMSFAGFGFSQTTQALINVGHWAGIVWVAGAGNDGQWQGRFPAGYNHVISVGSTEQDDRKSGFSSYHPTVDVMAPGGGIWSVFSAGTDAYTYMSGTSMASPMTAGLCGLLLSINPTMDPDEVQQCLKDGCENIDALNTDFVGFIGAGRINALNSVLCVPRLAAPIADFTFDKDSICVGQTVEFMDLSAEYPQQWTWNFGDGDSDSSVYSTSHVYTTPGTYSVELIVSNNVGADTLVFLDAIEVLPAPTISVVVVPGDSTGPILMASGCSNYSWTPSTYLSCNDCPNPYLPVVTPQLPDYVVSCTNEYGCTDTDTVFADQLVGNDLALTLPISVEPLYPNPSQGSLVLAGQFEKPGELDIRMLNLQGLEIAILHTGWVGKDFRKEIQLPEELAAGLYLIEWRQGESRKVQRLLLQP